MVRMSTAPHATISYSTLRAQQHTPAASLVSSPTASPVVRSAAVLLAVQALCEEVRAGFGSASFRMRMLDNVSLNVHAGEFVMLRGDRASGAHALRAVLAGTRAVRSGVRVVADGVAVRHATVSWDAVRVMLEAWHAPRRSFASVPRSVFVLRVRLAAQHETPAASQAQHTSLVARRWSAWAKSLRACQGSVVVHVPWAETLDASEHAPNAPDAPDAPDAPNTRYAPNAPHAPNTRYAAKRTSPTVQESAVGDDPSYWASSQFNVATVRTITLAGGRIISAAPVTPQMLTVQDSADASPTACHRCSTAWPAS